MKKSFGISTENVQVLLVWLWTKVKKNNFEECEKATVRPEKQKTEWPDKKVKHKVSNSGNYKDSNQLSKITKDHTKDAYKQN